MNISKLCEMINMPDEVTGALEAWNPQMHRKALERYWELIQEEKNWETAAGELKSLFKDDKQGLCCLAFLLHTCLKTYEQYQNLGISQQIFKDTMGCFSRFVKEHKESYDVYGFDREWWTARELSLKEFRLGELEFELTEEKGKKTVSIHIPSDARLGRQECAEAYKKAVSFFKEYAGGGYSDAEYVCSSWLLSPNLNRLLPENSNILSFQKDFVIDSYDPEDKDYMQWVFKNRTLNLEEVPQDTSLQRKMKDYLLNGGKIGAGEGHLKKEVLN